MLPLFPIVYAWYNGERFSEPKLKLGYGNYISPGVLSHMYVLIYCFIEVNDSWPLLVKTLNHNMLTSLAFMYILFIAFMYENAVLIPPT